VLKCLRSIKAEDFVALEGPITTQLACIDGFVFSEHPYRSFKKGNYAPITLMAGNVKDEGTIFTRSTPEVFSKDVYMSILDQLFGPKLAAEIIAVYPCEKFNASNCHVALNHVVGDNFIVCPTKLILDTYSGRAFGYVFTHTPSWVSAVDPSLGAYHSSEIPFVFSTLQNTYPHTPEEDQLAMQITSFWSDFAQHSDPDKNGEWPIYAAPRYTRTLLDLPSAQEDNYATEYCQFWNKVYDVLYG